MEYPHKTLLLNGRRVSIQKIIDETILGDTPFEISTLLFIKNWFIGQEKFLLKTSGSTGIPKKITATRKQLESSAKLTLQTLELKRGGKIFLCIDTQYIGGMMMLVRAFINSMKIEAAEPTSIKRYAKMPTVDLAAFVPIQIQTFLKAKKAIKNFNSLKNVIIGSAPLNDRESLLLSKCNTNIFATYGMTETLSHIALKRISPTQETIFRVLPTIKIKIDKSNCLVIKTPFLKKEIYTNDMVEIIKKDSFKWLGRFDNVINSGGVKVIPEQLELAIQKIAKLHAITNRFYLKGEGDKKLGEKIILIIEGKKLNPTLEKLFLSELKAKLPSYHAPKKIRYVQQFTVVNNKIKRE